MTEHKATATATREGKWWVVYVDGIGATQGRSVTEARGMAHDLVANEFEVDVNDVEVAITFDVTGELGKEVQEAREATAEAALAQEEAARKSRQAVADLKAHGLSGADIAAILELSPQRVSQLAKRSPEDQRKRNNAVREWAKKRGLKKADRGSQSVHREMARG